MRRSRGFVLSEVLMTILLQAGFILVLCGAFYLFLDFYTRTQQVLTARNHAQRVIQFMDDKIRHAGLGLWRCESSEEVRAAIRPFTDRKKLLENFNLPVALMSDHKNTTPQYLPHDKKVQYGSILTLLYGARNTTSTNGVAITVVIQSKDEEYPKEISDTKLSDNNRKYENILLLLDGSTYGVIEKNNSYVKSLFEIDSIESKTTKERRERERERYRMNRYAVAQGVGYPMYLHNLPESGKTKGYITAYTYNRRVTVNDASELIPLKCMKMYIHDAEDGFGPQFTFSETEPDIDNKNNAKWGSRYHQEMGILDIYMTLDTENNIFTLYVLATGGKNPKSNTPKPEAWPKDDEWLYSDEVVYVSRKSWKLNNIPDDFNW